MLLVGGKEPKTFSVTEERHSTRSHYKEVETTAIITGRYSKVKTLEEFHFRY